MADGKINRPYGGVLLLGIFLTPLLSLGHDYADMDGGMETEFSILFQMGGCRCGAVRFVWGGKFFVE